MCATSTVMNDFMHRYPDYQQPGWPTFVPVERRPSKLDFDDFLKMYLKAKAQDEAEGQPDCELDDKKARIQKMADDLGIEITFD